MLRPYSVGFACLFIFASGCARGSEPPSSIPLDSGVDRSLADVPNDRPVIGDTGLDARNDGGGVDSAVHTGPVELVPLGSGVLDVFPNEGEGEGASVAIAPSGEVLVSFREGGNGSYQAYVYRFNGSVWSPMGAPLGEQVISTALVVSGDEIYLSYLDRNRYPLHRWNGTSWAAVGTPTGQGSSFVPVVYMAAHEQELWLGYNEQRAGSNSTTGYLERLVAGSTTWTPSISLDDVPSESSYGPKLIAGFGRLYLMHEEGNQSHVRNLVAGTWSLVGSDGRLPTPPNHRDPGEGRLAVLPDSIVVAYRAFDLAEVTANSSMFVGQLRSGTWTSWASQVSAFSGRGTNCYVADMVADAAGQVYVAMSENTTDFNVSGSTTQLVVYRCTASGCSMVGSPNPATENGSNANGARLAIRQNGLPVVVWSERQGGQNRIFVQSVEPS